MPQRTTTIGDVRQFKHWLTFLLFVRNTPQSQEILTQYFLKEFLNEPELFYEFLLFVQKRLQNSKKKDEREQLAEQYLNVLSPLCERFGVFEEKTKLDHLCFRIANPEEYKEVEKVLSKYQKSAQNTIKNVLSTLRKVAKEAGIDCDVKGRYKNVYSIYRKLQKKKYTSAVTLNDIFAFRIIVKSNDVQECFEMVNLLHDHFSPNVERFKDYITIPKINGYQSIHTTLHGVIPKLDLPVEVQVRTEVMDEFSEKGMASHWLYARDKKSGLLTETEKKLLKHYTSLSEQLKEEKNITFFSFEGDLKQLPQGASALDYAYFVHTEVGKQAEAAEVNGKERDIDYYHVNFS
tara:strand:+ start:80 stop:1123 length:1044 start_codon:yes stop_codon:yes gene_type:complete